MQKKQFEVTDFKNAEGETESKTFQLTMFDPDRGFDCVFFFSDLFSQFPVLIK